MKKVHKLVKFTQNDCLKPYIAKNTDLRKKVKIAFKKDFFKLINNAVFGKAMKNLRQDRDINILQKILKQDLILQLMNWNVIPLQGRYEKGKIKK